MYTALKIILGAVLALIVLWLCYEPTHDKTAEYIANAKYDSVVIEIEYMKAEKEKLKDSIFGLNVEKGYLEVQLNKSESNITGIIENGKGYRIKRDTIKIVKNCDSLVTEVGEYIPLVDTFRNIGSLVDSLNWGYYNQSDSIDKIKDSLLLSNREQLFIERINNKKLQDKNLRDSKRSVVAVLSGIVLGFVLSLIIQK